MASANVGRFLLFRVLTEFTLWLPIWVIFFQSRGLTLAQIGFLDAITWACSALAEVPTGAVADTVGRKWALALGAALVGGAMLAVTTTALAPLFLFGYILWPVSWAFIHGADTALLYESLAAVGRDRDYKRTLGWASAATQVAQGVAGLLGGWLATYDMALCFTLSGALTLAGAAVALTFREPPRPRAPARLGSLYLATIRAGLRVVVRQPLVRYQTLFGATIAAFTLLVSFMLLQPYAAEVGVPVWVLGPLALATRAGSALGSVVAHRASPLLGTGVIVAGGPGLVAACLVLLGVLSTPTAVALFVVAAVVLAVMRPVLSDVLNRSVASGERATVLSVESVLSALLLAVVEPALFGLATVASLALALLVAAAVLVGLSAPVLILWRQAAARTLTPALSQREREIAERPQ